MKQVKRTQIFSQFGGLVIFAIFTTIITAAAYFGEGPAFSNSMAALWATGSSSFPYVAIPLASGMSMFWTQNPILLVLFNGGWFVNAIGVDFAVLFALSRNLFAWSFDRIMPTSFANVNDRARTPIYATLAMLAGGFLFTYVAVYQFGILASLFSYDTAGIFLAFLVVAVAAIVFPWRRKDIFNASDAVARRKVAGLPVITLLGILSIISSFVVLYAVLLPVISASFVMVLFEGISPTFIIGTFLYVIAWAVRRSQGIDLQFLQKQLHPE